MQCSDRVLQNGKIVQFKPNPICFQNILTKAAGKPVVFVTLCGSYQSGKSSTIKMLTGNCDIVIGNAMDEQTHGAYVYGPISYNFLRKRFHMKELPGDETQVFFVDTEGSSGFEAGEANEEANRYLLSQLIAPYAALSNVVTTIVRSAISTNEVETMKLILDIVKTVRQGTDLKNRSCLLALVPQTKDYDPTSGQFEDIQQRVTENVVKKFGSDFDITEVIPLSAYNINADILEQSPEFNAGFRIFAQHLINHIEETRKQVPIEAEGAVLIFKKLIEITDKQNLSEIAIDAMNDAKRHSFDKLYSPIADEVINNQISSIQKIIEELTNEIQNKEFVEAYQIDTTKICNEAYKELDEKLPPVVKNTNEVYIKFKNKIQEKILEKIGKLNEINEKINEIQMKYLSEKAKKIIKTKENELKEKINNCKLMESKEIMKKYKIEYIEVDCLKEYNKIIENKKINKIINDKVKEILSEESNKLIKELRTLAEKIIKVNIENQNKELINEANEIINKEVEKEMENIQNYNLTELNHCGRLEILRKLSQNCMEELKAQTGQTIHDEKAISKYINGELRKRIEELKDLVDKRIQEKKSESNKNIENNTINEINDKKIEIQKQIENKKSINFSDIDSLIKSYETEYKRKISNICDQSNFDENIKSNMEKTLKDNVTSLKDLMREKSNKNIENQYKELTKLVDDIVKYEDSLMKIKILNSNSEQLNSFQNNISNILIENCNQKLNELYGKEIHEDNKHKIKNYIFSQVTNNLQQLNQYVNDAIKSKSNVNYKKLISTEIESLKAEALLKMNVSKNVDNSFLTSLSNTIKNKCQRKFDEICDNNHLDENEKISLEADMKHELAQCTYELADEYKNLKKSKPKPKPIIPIIKIKDKEDDKKDNNDKSKEEDKKDNNDKSKEEDNKK